MTPARPEGQLTTPAPFTPAHRGGHGPPLVCLHGFTGTWRVWELVLGALQRRHDVFAPTLPGHRGGPDLPAALTTDAVLDAVEATLDAAGIGTAHLVGNSLGGYLALRLAARGRAESVVALAPAGGWNRGDTDALRATLARFADWQQEFRRLAPYADVIAATPAGRRRMLRAMTERSEHIAPELAAHQLLATATCPGLVALNRLALREGYELDAARIGCPARIVWGTEDRLLPWPGAATRYTRDWLPHADWVTLDGVGHCPQLDVPLEAAQLILGVTTA